MFPHDPVQEVIEHLDTIGHDPALLFSFMRKNSDFVRWCERIADTQFKNAATVITPMPAFDAVLALETTVFDNWKVDKKGPYQYGATIKAYTGSEVRNWKRPAWKGSAKMWPAAEAVKIAKKSKTTFSEMTMEKIAGMSDGGVGYVGVMKHVIPGEGTSYNDEHVIWVDVDPTDSRCLIHTPRFQAFTAPFDARDAKGKSLTQNAMLQSRSASSMALAGWATGEAASV